MSTGAFVSFEGSEGCGKTTQIRLLTQRLHEDHWTVHTVREPGGTPIGEKLRFLLKHDPDGRSMAPETELLLLNASRVELIQKVIRPALNRGEIVLSDRFFDSTLAYQGYGRGLPRTKVQSVIDFAVDGVVPDRTIWLKVDRESARRRLSKRTVSLPDRFEDMEQETFFVRVEQGFAELQAANPDRIIPVDANGSVEEVAERVWSSVRSLFRCEVQNRIDRVQ